MRARGGNLTFTTYDDASIAGVDAEACIAAAIGQGQLFITAANACRSDYGAPARLRVEGGGLSNTVLQRSLRIVSSHQAEDYACLTQIEGDLAIVDPTPADIAFPALAAVTGSLTADYPRENGQSRAIDLPSLASVGGDVSVTCFPPGGEISSEMEFGMPALTQIGGDLSIEFEGAGAGFDLIAGFDALAALEGDLSLQNRRFIDTSFSQLLPNLEFVSGSADLRPGLSTVALLDGLETVDGDFSLVAGSLNGSPFSNLIALGAIGGEALIELAGAQGGDLPVLASVGGGLAIRVDADFGLAADERYLPALADVGGVLRVFETGAPIARLGSLAVDAFGLTLEANPSLTDLPNDVGHVQIQSDGPISILDNPGISDCDAQDFVDSIPGYTGPVLIAGNGPC